MSRIRTKFWGGQLLRNLKIKEKKGYLGPFHDPLNPRMVQVGNEQALWYQSPQDLITGPFNLSAKEREEKRYNTQVKLQPDKVGPHDKLKDELVEEILQTDYGNVEGCNVMSKKLLRDLKLIASGAGINAKKIVTHRTVSGWQGKGKGLLQILWERGFIDENKIRSYKVRSNNEDGNMIPEMSLAHLMENCFNFDNEMSQLEFVCKSLGVRAVITAKFHGSMRRKA